MGSAARVFEIPKRSPDLNLLKNSFLNLVDFAQNNLSDGSRQELFQGCMKVLEQALYGVHEATRAVNKISGQARLGLIKNDRQLPAEKLLEQQLRHVPASGNFVLDMSSVEKMSIGVVARCLILKRELMRRGDRMIFRNVGSHLRDALENLQFDRMFEIEYNPEP